MTALNRKLIRDLLHMKGQSIAICLVIASGVATFVLSLSTVDALELTQTTYYERYRFAHVFSHLKRAPNLLRTRIAEIPGVAAVQTRVVADVTLDVHGLVEPAVGRLISIPETTRPRLNGLHLRRGRWIEPGRSQEVLASEAFCDAHSLNPGDTVVAVINGRRQQMEIVGVALSPEYIYQIQPGEIIPDDKRFGVFWMGDEALSAAFDMDNAFNNVCLALMPGASEPDVLARLDRLTAAYGGLGAYGRKDQLSHSFVSDELKQLRGMALIPPSIFLSVAAFLLNVVLTRLISTQREQIAALKAFGYSNIEVGLHYFKLVLVIAVTGAVLGTAVGSVLGYDLTEMYTQYFRFPFLEYHLGLDVVVLALAVTAAAATIGVFGAVQQAVNLPPAEAMRPEPPAKYNPTFIERLGLDRLFSHGIRMIVRNLQRQPVKSMLSSLGIAMAGAVMVLGSYMEDTINYVMDYQFFISQRHDISLSFVEPVESAAMHEIEHLPGVLHTEPVRTVPVRLRYQHQTRRIAIMGMPPNARLNRLLDADLQDVPLPPGGMVLSKKLADILGFGIGDVVTVEVLEGSRIVREVPVVGLVTGFIGTAAYMDLRTVNRLLREGDTISGAFLTVDASQSDTLYSKLKSTPKVAGVTVKRGAFESFKNTLAEHLLTMRAFNVVFASIIAFGVVYNSARISLSERSRDLASLRVLGFTRAEISFILLGELAILTLVAIPIGLIVGYAFAALSTAALDTETHRFPLIVEPATYAYSVSVLILAAFISGLVVRRKLDHLDLVAVLKTKE